MLNNGTVAHAIRLKNKGILALIAFTVLGTYGETTAKAPTGRQRKKSVE